MSLEGNTGWIALLALAISTGSLTLEIRRWFESGVKLKLTCSIDIIKVMPGKPPNLNERYILVHVSNRGDTPTTLESLTLVYQPPSRNESLQHFVLDSSQNLLRSPEGQLPYFLESGSRWGGMFIQNESFHRMLDEGKLYLRAHANHSDKPIKVRIRKRKKQEEEKLDSDQITDI